MITEIENTFFKSENLFSKYNFRIIFNIRSNTILLYAILCTI